MENKFYQALMYAPVAICVFRGPDLVIEFVNNIVHDIVGIDRELVGYPLEEAVPDLDKKTLERIKSVFRTGEPYSEAQDEITLDYEHKGNPHTRIWNVIFQPLRNEAHEIDGVLTCAYEVTQHLKSLASIQELTNKLQLIADSIPIHLLIVDADERFTFVNEEAAHVWQLRPNEFVGKTIRDVAGPEAQEALHKFTNLVLKGQRVFYESPFKFPDGQVRFFLNTYTPTYNDEKKVTGFIATGIDITERKKLESQVAFERYKLKTIFESSPAAMALWRGPEMIFEMINPGYQEIFPDRELIGKTFLEGLPELADQPFLGWLSEVLRTGKPFTGKEVLARHSSSLNGPIEDHFYDFTYYRIDSENCEPYGIYCHAIDVTERVLNRKALEKAIHELRDEREAREQFVAALTHDMRTPLMASKVSAQILARKFGDIQEVQKISHRISEHIDRADEMLRDLLDAVRIKAGEPLPLERELCSLNEVITGVIDELSTIHGDRFEVQLASSIVGSWSFEGLHRIIENLCTNAIKYGDPGQKVRISTFQKNHQAEIQVHNFGNPISEQDMGKLFNPFQRTRTASGKKGWGIGLTLVKGLVDAHKGSINVQSDATRGTTFTVAIPLESNA